MKVVAALTLLALGSAAAQPFLPGAVSRVQQRVSHLPDIQRRACCGVVHIVNLVHHHEPAQSDDAGPYRSLSGGV
jgi:hypothetical protein